MVPHWRYPPDCVDCFSNSIIFSGKKCFGPPSVVDSMGMICAISTANRAADTHARMTIVHRLGFWGLAPRCALAAGFIASEGDSSVTTGL